MAYHMPRIVHWIANQSVGFYPTYELKQLHMPPWHEFATLQFHLLGGSDQLDNLVSWFSLVGSVTGVGLIARQLGGRRRAQLLSAFIAAAVPEAVLTSSGAKNDADVTFWIVSTVYFFLCLREAPCRFWDLFGLSVSLGVAVLTKGTAPVLIPALLVPLFLLWKREAQRQLLPRAGLVAVAALAINTPQFSRNIELFGSPLGPLAETSSGAFKYTNDAFNGYALVENLIRNVALHLGTPSQAINQGIEGALDRLIILLGGSPNDPLTTWTGTQFHVPAPSLHEAVAGAPLHLMLAVSVAPIVFIWTVRWLHVPAIVYAWSLFLAFLCFCLIFQWQPWHTRLHLPLFVLGSVAVAYVVALVRSDMVALALSALLLVAVSPDLLENALRPLAFSGGSVLASSRLDQYFADRRDLEAPALEAVSAAESNGCRQVALDLTAGRYEYPLLVLLGEADGNKPILLGHIPNDSSRYANGLGPIPCAVICTECASAPEQQRAYLAEGREPSRFGNIVVYGSAITKAWSDSWVGPILVERVSATEQARHLRVQGDTDLTYLGGKLTLKFAVDGNLVGARTLTGQGANEFSFDLPVLAPPGDHTVTIMASGSFVPANGDTRHLSYRLLGSALTTS
jgi:hypothetical protein